MFSKIKQRIKQLSWQEKVLCVAILFFIIFYSVLFSAFHQFPSEYYGGDHYAHFASALKIYNTFNPFISSHYYGELQHYPWLVSFLIAGIARLTFQDPFTVAIFFPIFIIIATLIITYWCGNLFFRNKTAALLLTMSWAVMLVPNFHPSEFAKQMMIPLITVMILLLYRQERKMHLIIAGILYGLAGLEHLVTFVVASLSIFFLFIIKLIETRDIKKQSKCFFVVCCIGLAIASLFWLPIVIKYHAHTLNDWQIYSSATILPSAELVAGFFLPSLTIYEILFLISACIIFCFAFKKRDTQIFIPLILFSATLIGIIHPYFTYSTVGISLGYYRFPIVLDFLKHFVIVWALWLLWSEIIKRVETKASAKTSLVKVMFFVACLVAISMFFFNTIQNFQQSERYVYAIEDNELITAYRSLNTFIQEKNLIQEDEVTITTHPDFGFFFNAMTGKNVMVDRITHASSFVDPDKRAADMAIILYGTNRTKAKELIEEYHLGYGFIERGSVEFKSTCLGRWNETKSSKKDKTLSAYWCIQTSSDYKKYLRENGIETATASVRLAAGDKDVPLKKVLVVKPSDILLETKTIYQYVDTTGNILLELYEITE